MMISDSFVVTFSSFTKSKHFSEFIFNDEVIFHLQKVP